MHRMEKGAGGGGGGGRTSTLRLSKCFLSDAINIACMRNNKIFYRWKMCQNRLVFIFAQSDFDALIRHRQ